MLLRRHGFPARPELVGRPGGGAGDAGELALQRAQPVGEEVQLDLARQAGGAVELLVTAARRASMRVASASTSHSASRCWIAW